MNRILDQGIIFLYCLLSITIIEPEYYFILAFLLIIIYVGVNSYGERKEILLVSSICMIIIGAFIHQLLFFIPLAIYNLLKNKLYPVIFLLFVQYLYFWSDVGVISIIFVSLGTILCVYLYMRTTSFEKLKSEFTKIRDDSTESTISLQKKNKALLENQDYEVNNATLKERNRIAREIHDNVGHMLSRAILMTGALLATSKEESVKEQASKINDTLNTAMTSIRESVHDLHDESIDLEQSSDEVINAFTFCSVEFEYDMGLLVQREVKYAFLAILKEGLNNVIKHSSASKVIISMVEHPAIYQLTIWDNGSNVKGKHRDDNTTGIGLTNIEDRVENLNGKLRIHTDDGFRLFVTIPKQMGDKIHEHNNS
ncbi:MAG: histidine kinase [Suipraeoptans sp.]